LVVPCGFACYMTLSRGSFVAILAGLVVLALMRPRAATLVTAVPALAPVGVLAVVLQRLDKVKGPPPDPPVQGSQGELLAALVMGLAVVAGVVYALLAPRVDAMRRPRWRPSFRLARALAIGATAVILVGTVAISYASEQSEHVTTSASRVTEAKTFRGPYWDVALGAFADHPLTGVGSGSFLVEWRRANVVPRGAFDAHSLYFETLGELGIVGGLLLAALVASIALGVAAAARAMPRDPVLPAAAAVLAAAAVHVGVDWDWEQPGVMMPVLLLAAAALVRPEPDIDSVG
jgi:O-antigen ligase